MKHISIIIFCVGSLFYFDNNVQYSNNSPVFGDVVLQRVEKEEIVEEIKETPKKEEEPIYNFDEVMFQLQKYIGDNGARAYVKGMTLDSHINWHDLKDGVVNYPKSVVAQLNTDYKQFLHGMLHAIEDGEYSLTKTSHKEEKTLDLSNNRIIFLTDTFCGPCNKFKATGMLDQLKESGWTQGKEEEKHIQLVGFGEETYGVKWVGPTMYLMLDGRIDRKTKINPLTFIEKDGTINWDRFIEWSRPLTERLK